MFYRDIYFSIGTCDLEKGRLAAATEAFKEVLLRDDEHVVAWLKRGQVFERMGAPLLTLLHYNRMTELHKLLQDILQDRRHRDKCVSDEHDGKWTEAKRRYERALDAIKELEQVAPTLLKSEEDLGNTRQCTSNHAKQVDCRPDRECGHGEKKTTRTNGTTSFPKANDLPAILDMFYRDIYFGIGTCDLEKGLLAAATEAFKEVLLRDDEHVVAWLKRGQVFERMGAPLLTLLHYNRMTELVKVPWIACCYFSSQGSCFVW
ncbi:hypothetical protein PsorP6_000252 [Peronosclerospora sorghi]|uniref:Uncharacterized protein n=1 Tax=Peronosclerospora sorghi TaxID=230839 RepID=A0ACC0WY86_9STRA|nr:hypothetical protein PsorP6_000252 [Peronosclerospora sorghi]